MRQQTNSGTPYDDRDISAEEAEAIDSLMWDAGEAGDPALVEICWAALRGDLAARLRVSLTIAAARAMENDR